MKISGSEGTLIPALSMTRGIGAVFR